MINCPIFLLKSLLLRTAYSAGQRHAPPIINIDTADASHNNRDNVTCPYPWLVT